MTPAPADTTETAAPETIRDRLVDTTRRVAHVSHEAQLLNSMAADALQDTAYTVNRALKSARRDLQATVDRFDDLRDDAARWIKHQPFRAFAIGIGTGLALGIAIVASFGRCRASGGSVRS